MGLLVAIGFIRHLAMMTYNPLARPCAGIDVVDRVKVNRSPYRAKKTAQNKMQN